MSVSERGGRVGGLYIYIASPAGRGGGRGLAWRHHSQQLFYTYNVKNTKIHTMSDRGPCRTCIGTIKAGGIVTNGLEFAKLSILFGSGNANLSFAGRCNCAIFLNISRRLS